MQGIFKDRRRQARPETTDRRSNARTRVLLNGKIVYGTGYTANCSIRDLTPAGAKLVLAPNEAAPSDFYLIVVRNGVAHRSRTLWRREAEAGVAFDESHDFAQPTPAYLKPVRELWAHLAPQR